MTQPSEATQIQEQLAGLPEDEQTIKANFWQDLRPSGLYAACPKCGTPRLLARYARGSQRRWWYVLHCDDVRQVTIQ